MGRRTVLLIVAVLVAALGTGLVFAYVNRTDERALKDQQPVDVLVANALIKAGTIASDAEGQGAFTLQRIPRAATVKGYLIDTRSITNQVAVSDIYPGEQIIPAKFANAGSTTLLTIPTGRMAMSVQMGDPQRVAGFVRPGSEVAIILSIVDKGKEISRVLVPRIAVLAIGPTTLRPAASGEANTEPVPTAILTLSVDQVQAQKLAYAVAHGSMYFTLLTKDSKVGPGQPISADNLFN